jgi:hypothetical protein
MSSGFLRPKLRKAGIYPGGFMRSSVLLPLTALVVVAAGCGSKSNEQAVDSNLQRDLTLVTRSAQVQIASPAETERPRVQRRTVNQSRRAVGAKVQLASTAVATPTRKPMARPTSMVMIPANDRELLPGKTVTVVPTSSGPSTGSNWTDQEPAIRGRTGVARKGGTCRGRGRKAGIGIAAGPRPNFRAEFSE